MKYAAIISNDITNGEGVCVSFFVQGCPHHCKGCFNPETWDFDGGYEFNKGYTLNKILKAINANGIERNFNVLGGEPLATQNLELTHMVVEAVRLQYPNIKISLWTGYTMEEIFSESIKNNILADIINKLDLIIDGPFIEEEKDLSLRLRGSRNQHIYKKINGEWKLDE